MSRFDAFDGTGRQVSNVKPLQGEGHLTDLTDLTVNERGCTYRASAGALAHPSRLLPTYPTTAVKSVKYVKRPAPSCGFVLTRDVKRGVNLTAAARRGWSHE
jgi:hypothetical protein